MTTRRSFITGLISFAVTAPAIVRATSLMPVKQMIEFVPVRRLDWKLPQGRLVHDVRDLWKLPSAAR